MSFQELKLSSHAPCVHESSANFMARKKKHYAANQYYQNDPSQEFYVPFKIMHCTFVANWMLLRYFSEVC